MRRIAWYLGQMIWCFKRGLDGSIWPKLDKRHSAKQDYLNGWNAALDDAIEKTTFSDYHTVSVEYLEELKHRYQ